MIDPRRQRSIDRAPSEEVAAHPPRSKVREVRRAPSWVRPCAGSEPETRKAASGSPGRPSHGSEMGGYTRTAKGLPPGSGSDRWSEAGWEGLRACGRRRRRRNPRATSFRTSHEGPPSGLPPGVSSTGSEGGGSWDSLVDAPGRSGIQHVAQGFEACNSFNRESDSREPFF